MFDPDIINEIAREGFKLIVQSGILDKQLDRLKERLAFGNSNEPDESLVESIKEFRRQYGIIESLRSLGEGYNKENEQ
jgi:hypothetical protein